MKENQKKTEVYGITPDELTTKIASIIDSKINNLHSIGDEFEKPIDINEASEFLGLSISNLHMKTMKREIPFHKASGKKSKLYFFKSQLLEFIKDGRVKTIKELGLEGEDFCNGLSVE